MIQEEAEAQRIAVGLMARAPAPIRHLGGHTPSHRPRRDSSGVKGRRPQWLGGAAVPPLGRVRREGARHRRALRQALREGPAGAARGVVEAACASRVRKRSLSASGGAASA